MADMLRDGAEEVVQFRPPTGRARYLLRVFRSPCGECGTGTRTLSLWVTETGRGETVAWCSHCFNAVCERVQLRDEDRVRFRALQAAVSRGHVSRPWEAVRPALEDLERRGLL